MIQCNVQHSLFILVIMQGDEWEEKWGEQYWNLGRANKYADKWGREGTNVWHERWGEDYDGSGGCFKYTDKVPASLNSCFDDEARVPDSQGAIFLPFMRQKQVLYPACSLPGTELSHCHSLLRMHGAGCSGLSGCWRAEGLNSGATSGRSASRMAAAANRCSA